MRPVALAALLMLAGCDLGRAFIATPNDHADYRRVRAARTLDDRLAAAWEYLRERPDGRHADALRAWFERTEPAYFAARMRTIAGLEAYLRAMPDGPHAEEALQVLVERRSQRRRDGLEERAARATMLRTAAEEEARRRAGGMVVDWARALLDPAAWEGTFDEAPAELLSRFRLIAPAPICEVGDGGGQRCEKRLVRRFVIRGAEGRVARELSLTITLELDSEYRLHSAELRGAHLALRTHEADENEALEDGDAALHALIARIVAAARESDRACAADGSRDDLALLLRCPRSGLVLTMPAADRLIIERAER